MKWFAPGIGTSVTALFQRSFSSWAWRWNSELSCWPTQVAIGMRVAGGISAASAQNYPARPVQVVIPFPTGGVTDIEARMFMAKLAESMGRMFRGRSFEATLKAWAPTSL